MKTMIRTCIVISLLVFAVFANAQSVFNFDAAPADTNYWEWFDPLNEGGEIGGPAAHYATSTNADPDLGWIHKTYITDNVYEGAGAMQVDYSVHNSEGWGGYTKFDHRYPDSSAFVTYDWSLFDSISFAYNNIVPQSEAGRVHIRFNLIEYGEVEAEDYTGQGEFYYSFQYVLDNEPGWNHVTIALDHGAGWGGDNFTHTGWAGDGGDGFLDRDAIKGYSFEFSVSGGGEGDVVTGSVIFDDLKLVGSLNVLDNAGFEEVDEQDDDYGWGATHAGEGAAHAMVTTDAAIAHSGDNFAEIGTENGAAWSVFYTESVYPAAMGETWEMGGYIKEISPEFAPGAFGGFKIESKDADGGVVESTGDVMFDITQEYQLFTTQFVMPAGTDNVAAVLVASRWDGSNSNYAFDDIYLQNLGNLDTEAPVAVTGIDAIAATYYNLITWTDVPDESDETYTVYASRFPITDLDNGLVDVVTSGTLQDVQTAIHYIYAPINDETQEWYYAVSCTDASQNAGPPGFMDGSLTNVAKGVPTIALGGPADFVADGDMSEWIAAGITPFFLGATENSYGTPHVIGEVDDNSDMSGNIYLAVDDDYLYLATDAIDNVYDGYLGEGNWWEYDAFELFIGLYNQRDARHSTLKRGDEPDYKLLATNNTLVRDVNGQHTLGEPGDGEYYFEGFNPDYVVEARVSLDSLASAAGFTDARFHPEEGMRIIFEPTYHDRDGAGAWEGNVVMSATNEDNAHQTPTVWSYTFIGSTDAVSIDSPVSPSSYSLSENYPNPFNPSTMINYSLGQAGVVRVVVYNVLGQEVRTLVNDFQNAGSHQIQFDASDLASGVYIYRLETADFTATNKMILMK